MIRAFRERDRSDEGMTLTEVLITSIILVILLGMVFGSMSLIDNVGSNVTAQYQEFDQALPAMAPFHSLLAAEVEPAPPVNGVPTPGFASIGNFAMTFYANIGTAYDNTVSCPVTTPPTPTCAGTTAGPAKIVAGEYDSSGHPVTTGATGTTCNASSQCSLQVRMFLPITGVGSPGQSTCPGVGAGPTCLYPTTYKLLANIQGVVNSPSDVDPITGAPLNPIFTYVIEDPSLNQSITLSSSEVDQQALTGLTPLGYSVPNQNLSTCVAPTSTTYPLAISCPLDAIQSVGLDLQIQKPGADSNAMVENSLVVYRYAQSPGSTTSPYQYSATVG
jgi:Tfp pilus assembly protein PilV